jgi:hypothetical protein
VRRDPGLLGLRQPARCIALDDFDIQTGHAARSQRDITASDGLHYRLTVREHKATWPMQHGPLRILSHPCKTDRPVANTPTETASLERVGISGRRQRPPR